MPVAAVEVLDFAATLPETSERDYREHSTIVCFRGRGIGMVSVDGRHLYVKALATDRDVMIESDPETYSEWWAAGRFGWVRVRLDRIEPDEARELVLEAWRLTAPKRLVKEYDAAHPIG
jgi:hypothetical protein